MEHDNVNHPKHYTEGFAPVNIECVDITRHMDFCLGNAFKYVWRAGKKGGKKEALEDLEKAKWYLYHASGVGAPLAARVIFDEIPRPVDNAVEAARYGALRAIIYASCVRADYIDSFSRYFKENSK